MNVAIVFDSRTGTTATAARAMADAFTAKGHHCVVKPVAEAKPEDATGADLICIGSWTQGLFFFMQHATPGTMQFIERLKSLSGKKAVVFCTYKLATGKMLPAMAQSLSKSGAEVVGQFKFRGPRPTPDFEAFVGQMTSA